MHRYLARSYYGTLYMGTDGRWNGANSLIGRGHTVTKAGPDGGADVLCLRIDHRVGPLHREIAWLGGTQGGLNCLTNPRPPMPSEFRRRIGGGWGGVTIGRAEAPIGLPPRALRIPPYHCCRPAFRQVGDKNGCR